MYREEKQASRVCTKRWQERAYQLHRKKLADIRPSIDNKTPQMYPHLYQKLKKAQKEEELCSEIERDNRTLVKRMTEIMKRPGIDTHNESKSKSLNKEARQRELLRITEENQKLLKRIHSRQPTYNHLSWEQDREKSEMLCARICTYPYRPRTTAEKNLYYYESPTAAEHPPPHQTPAATDSGYHRGRPQDAKAPAHPHSPESTPGVTPQAPPGFAQPAQATPQDKPAAEDTPADAPEQDDKTPLEEPESEPPTENAAGEDDEDEDPKA
eukprot:TRINITY_DN22411_c0_g1_i1.p1 TRINITY_DN22411_c0_g1~~TRINITY_DN22411_c0_g1_i1.p1  ORF type:complete len:269 (+),score=117.24 TRINITY_DN22411_c0_g1_i1:84-890(+)